MLYSGRRGHLLQLNRCWVSKTVGVFWGDGFPRRISAPMSLMMSLKNQVENIGLQQVRYEEIPDSALAVGSCPRWSKGQDGRHPGGLCQQYPQFRGEVLPISKFCRELLEETAEKRKTGSDCLIRRQPVWGYEVLEMCAIDHCR